MKKTAILIYLIVFASSSFAQNKGNTTIDSLKTELRKVKEDTIKVEILNQLSSETNYLDNTISLNYALSANKLAKKIFWNKGIADSYANLGKCYWVKSNFSKAFDYSYKSLKIHEKINNKEGVAKTNNLLGIIYIDEKKYSQALNHYSAALKLNLESKDQKMTSTYLNNIGDVYMQQKKYTNALKYFQEALRLNKLKKDSTNIAFNLTNLGITYNSMKNYSKGINYINQSITIYKNDKSLYNGYNKFELGRAHYFMSLDEKNNEKKQSLLNKSIAYFHESIEIFKKFNSLNDLQTSYSFVSKASREKGNYKESLEYSEKSYTLKSSIFSNENKKQIANLESQREIDLRDKQIIIQNLKIKSDSRKVYLLFTIATAIAILLGLFFWLYLSKRKTNLQLKEKNKTISNINTQKDKFFSIIAHDLRGPFNGFLGLTELLADDLDSMTPDEIQFAAGSMKSSANNLYRLLENLLEWSRMEQGLIAFKPQENKLKSVVDECTLTFKDSAQKKEIKIKSSIDEEVTVFADNNILHAVIRNILSNAVKFTPRGGMITIQGKEDDKNTTISITDSGIGMNAKMIDNLFRLDVQTNRKGTNDEPSTGLGLILCKEFVEKHNGKIWLESIEDKGTTFYFSFPKALR